MRVKVFVCYLFFLFWPVLVSAQHNDWWMTNTAEQIFIDDQMQPDKYFHSSIHPYQINELSTEHLKYEFLFKTPTFDLQLGNYNEDTLERKFFDWKIYPLMDFQIGDEENGMVNRMLYHAALGLGVRSNIGQQWSVDLNYMYGLRNFSKFDRLYHNQYNAWPGLSYTKPVGRSATGAHYMNGSVTWSPSSYFAIQAGYGKHHWGEGERSMFLSNQSAAYPYGEIEAEFWRMKYVVLYTFMQDRYELPAGLSKRNKYMTMHYLSWNIIDNLNLSLFEAVIWQSKDTLANRGYDINYLNPVIFFRPVEYAQGSADNVLLGLSLSYKATKNHQFYFQWLLDEFLLSEITAGNGWWANKFSIQAGYKTKNLFSLDGLYAQVEYNWSRPFTYSHGNSWQNYGHWNQPLAHPFGSNFMEIMGIVRYTRNRWYFSNRFSWVAKGFDPNNISEGGNIFTSYENRDEDYNHTTLQGQRVNFWQNYICASYLLFPDSQLRIEAGLNSTWVETKTSTNFYPRVTIGIRSAIWNIRDSFR